MKKKKRIRLDTQIQHHATLRIDALLYINIYVEVNKDRIYTQARQVQLLTQANQSGATVILLCGEASIAAPFKQSFIYPNKYSHLIMITCADAT